MRPLQLVTRKEKTMKLLQRTARAFSLRGKALMVAGMGLASLASGVPPAVGQVAT